MARNKERGGGSALAWFLIFSGVGLGVYALTSTSKKEGYIVPPGGKVKGFVNNSNIQLIINSAGTIIDALGNVWGAINNFQNAQDTGDEQDLWTQAGDINDTIVTPDNVAGVKGWKRRNYALMGQRPPLKF